MTSFLPVATQTKRKKKKKKRVTQMILITQVSLIFQTVAVAGANNAKVTGSVFRECTKSFFAWVNSTFQNIRDVFYDCKQEVA